jgi:hypothetical protein
MSLTSKRDDQCPRSSAQGTEASVVQQPSGLRTGSAHDVEEESVCTLEHLLVSRKSNLISIQRLSGFVDIAKQDSYRVRVHGSKF